MRSLSPTLLLLSSPHRVTQQILSHWQSFLDLNLMFEDSCHVEQLSLNSQLCIVTTVEDSVLRTEMADLESQEEDLKNNIVFIMNL
jgi:hypothetical protein